MLRGIAILGIFFMNIPFMAASVPHLFGDIRAIGWTPLDHASWWAVRLRGRTGAGISAPSVVRSRARCSSVSPCTSHGTSIGISSMPSAFTTPSRIGHDRGLDAMPRLS